MKLYIIFILIIIIIFMIKKKAEKKAEKSRMTQKINHFNDSKNKNFINTIVNHSYVINMDKDLIFAFGRTGSKARLRHRIHALMPKEFSTYVEPFVGGGSVFLGYKFKHLDFSNIPSFIGHASKKIHDPSPTIKRWAMFKAWRNTGETNPCSQMAWCDPTSIHPLEMINYKVPDHLVKKYIEANNDPNYSHHMLLFSKKPEITHNWYYYSEMTYDEVVLFRLYDSSLLKTKRWFTPHSSFLFPGRQDTPRSSIETEINCLWFD